MKRAYKESRSSLFNWSNLSITMKLQLGVIGLFFVMFSINTSISYFQAHNNMMNGLHEGLIVEAEKTSMRIDDMIQAGVNTVDNLSQNHFFISYMRNVTSKDQVKNRPEYAAILKTLRNIKASNSNFNLVYIGMDKSGYLLDDTEWVNPADYVLKERDWYRSIVDSGKTHVTKAYQDKITGKMVVTIGTPIKDADGTILGVAAVDFSIDGITQLMRNYQYRDSGYAFLLDQDGMFLYHPDQNKILNENLTQSPGTIGEIARRMVKGETDTSRYVYENTARYLGFAPISSSGWSVGIVVPETVVSSMVNKMRNINLLIFLATMILMGLLIRLISNSILRPIPGLLAAFKAAATGDLTVEIPVASSDEIGKLADGFNQMIRQQNESMQSVLTVSNQIKNASSEIAAGNQNLSQRTQEEASTLEEIAATIEEMTASIQQTAANSGQADHASHTTLEVVREGEKAVSETVDAMSRITQSSREIGEIIKVVNDIAFQTNLLALNAAVEAARAGEQGRGFAVVAAEVRNLAGRTAESSKEIEKLIKESLERVDRGNASVRKSGEMLRQIVENTQQTSDVVVEIGAAIREQASAANQIQKAINQMNEVTQQNAAMVEEMAASSETLNAEAEGLEDLVSKFQIEDEKSGKSESRRASQLRLDNRSDSRRITPMPKGAPKDFEDDDLSRF